MFLGISAFDLMEKLKVDVSINQNMRAIITLILFVILAKGIATLFKIYFTRWVQKTSNTIDDELVGRTEYPFLIMIILIGVNFSLQIIRFDNTYVLIVQSLIVLISAYIIASLSSIFLKYWEEQWVLRTDIKIDNIMFSVLDKTISILILSVALLIILERWNLNIVPILASLGIAGVIIGFGLKDIIANMFNGLFLILDKAYNYNDTIELNTGELGNVLEVGFRSTRIKTFNNEILIIPNSEIANLTIKNYSEPSNRIRTDVSFVVEYGNEPKRIKEIILNALKKVDIIFSEPAPILYFEEMNEHGMRFTVLYWIGSYKDKTRSKDSVNLAVYYALKNSGVKLAHAFEYARENNKRTSGKNGKNQKK